MSRVAVVTIAHGRHEHLTAQHDSLAGGTRPPDDYVAVAMDDPAIQPVTRRGLAREVLHLAADPRGRPLAAARNRGVERALSRGADTVVVLDVDCLAGRDLVAAYAGVVAERPDRVWSGPVTYLPPPPTGGYDLDRLDEMDDPHPGRPDPGPSHVLDELDPDLFWSLSFAVTRTTWHRVGGFCEDYVGYGAEDTDFGHRVVQAGSAHAMAGGARAFHQWHEVSTPPVEHLDDILRNGEIFRDRWGRWPMEDWLEAFAERGLVARRQASWVRADGSEAADGAEGAGPADPRDDPRSGHLSAGRNLEA